MSTPFAWQGNEFQGKETTESLIGKMEKKSVEAATGPVEEDTEVQTSYTAKRS
jgi:hypothetical protein